MQSFISETIDDILKTTNSFEDAVFILPSQRAKVFVKQTIKDKISVGFLPETINIEQFIQNISGVQKADNIQLLFHFYTIYRSVEKNPDSFDTFSSWALTVLQDFNEIDQHLINTKDIFIYLRDIERLKKWSVNGTFKETTLIKDHYSFLEKLNTYYNAFYEFLISENIGYQGLMYREACKKIDDYLEKNKNKKFFFIGFNALNKAEERLFQKVLESGNSEIYWDLDETFFNSNHQAGKFIRKYKSSWRYYEKNPLKSLGNTFSAPKKIQVIGAAKNNTQIKYIGEILEATANFKNTALVLADETLLPVTLNSLPKNISAINITMGYPLKDIPTTGLLFSIFDLFNSQEKLQKSTLNEFYYKDVLRFFKHQSMYGLIATIDDFTAAIAKDNQTFIKESHLEELLKEETTEIKTVILNVFKTFDTVGEFIDRILALINLLKEEVNALEKEYLFRFYTVFTQLQTLQNEFQYFVNLKTLALFFKQLISSESLSFQGEPLKGLQLMGMLETRVLDFENIILASANEGVLPASSQQNTFIPFDVKVEYGLPTYREKDAIFSYHFFRLMQRAKNVFIVYNTEHDIFGSGEKSRFVTQLEMMRTDIVQKIISPRVVAQNAELKIISKNELVFERLREIAKAGFSPSSLTNYLYNPVAFYKQKVLRIKEVDDVEETVAYNTLGTVVHEALDELYKPFMGQFLTVDAILEMEKIAKDLVIKHFKIQFKNGDLSTGKNRLIFEVANRFVTNFLSQEKELLKDEKNQLKIIATEENLSAEIVIEGIDFPIKIHGNVDRVDELNGEIRIIDYKSGMVQAAELKVLDFEKLREKEQYKSIQVLIYAYLYSKEKKFDFSKNLKAGIFSFKNLNSGFLAINFSANYRKPDTIITEEKLDEFMEELKVYIKEIYDPKIDFIEPADLRY
ncbi:MULTISPECIES: PD-(D/E)XK nuclease family protein [unclassified Polaribacter]|uniref:PD-(D/E)XK nuclease family protein n=1 Tax=unclassified Polaribacter TaxID=196858 RepID=UPI0011BE7586|nr:MULTISPECIES: PD-(D/E)XK nuclease family protein [unclassified Polaribacter]TXD52448.1 PD-(D/E)XK nuclease family protein [Polaribacter sp. IC063]TXD61086.1 PD-(D/E)XK nuclease family protein [Polaribacter sp. IC066]